MRDAAQPIRGSRPRTSFAAVFGVLLAALFGASAAKAVEMSAEVANLYSSVSIYPPSATSMTVCYGFVCRRREILDFTAGDRSALTQIMAAGRASAAAERAAVQKAVVWFDRRMGPILGTNKRVAKADFRYFDDKHNYDCWDTTRNTTSLLLVLQEWGLLEASRDRRSPISRQYAGAADAAQHRGAGRSRHQGRMGRRSLAARLSAATRRDDGPEMGYGRLSGRFSRTMKFIVRAEAVPAPPNAHSF